jgi:hypothetical protein
MPPTLPFEFDATIYRHWQLVANRNETVRYEFH